MNNPILLLKKYLEAKTERNNDIILFSAKTKSVDLPKQNIHQEKKPAKIPDFLQVIGSNKNNLTIITSISPEYTKLNKASLLLLKKILKSVDIDYADINIITLKENLLLDHTQKHTDYIAKLAASFSPKLICVMGNFTASIMLGSDDIDSLRGKTHTIENIKTIATLSPRYIVATEAKTSPDEVKPEKMKVWQDMKIIKKLIS